MSPTRRIAPLLALLAICGALLPAVPPAAADESAGAGVTVVQRRTDPIYSYEKAIRENVEVTTPLDNDGDGTPDTVNVDIIRPREPADADKDIPVIMVASPYFDCCGRGNEGERKEYASDGTVTKFPLYYDNYFVPRGYAVAHVDVAGTARSFGCSDVGGREEILGTKAVVDWLNGRTTATYGKTERPADADWTTGKVGMIGKSWDGTIANGVAATGVEGLETIVPIGAISSWYDYSRYQGNIRNPRHHTYLHDLVSSRTGNTCAAVEDDLATGSADDTGNYNDYWAERDYRKDAANVKASVFVVHGINDRNVTTRQFAEWWSGLADNGVPRKIWLGQPGHVDPFDFRRAAWVSTLHKWFDHWLQGIPNDVMDDPMASLEGSDGTWRNESTWPAAKARTVELPLGAGDGTTGTIGGDAAPDGTTRTFTDDPDLSESAILANPSTGLDGRLAFLSGTLTRDVRISGTPALKLRIRVDKPTTELSARLADYGSARRVDFLSRGQGVHNLDTESCWGESTDVDDACYIDTTEDFATRDHTILTRGYMNAAHFSGLGSPTPLKPDQWYDLEVPLQAYDSVLRKGHVLGLMLTASDTRETTPFLTGATIDVDLAKSRLVLPMRGSLPKVKKAPEVSADPVRDRPSRREEFR